MVIVPRVTVLAIPLMLGLVSCLPEVAPDHAFGAHGLDQAQFAGLVRLSSATPCSTWAMCEQQGENIDIEVVEAMIGQLTTKTYIEGNETMPAYLRYTEGRTVTAYLAANVFGPAPAAQTTAQDSCGVKTTDTFARGAAGTPWIVSNDGTKVISGDCLYGASHRDDAGFTQDTAAFQRYVETNAYCNLPLETVRAEIEASRSRVPTRSEFSDRWGHCWEN